jgi:hypothetical protein
VKLAVAVAAVLIVCWFFLLAGVGLGAWFTEDDLMNMYQAAHTPAAKLAANLFMIRGGLDRPLGTLVVKAQWQSFGFNPLGYHIVCFLLLLANLALGAALMWRLSSSFAATLAGTLLFSFHAYLTDLYLNCGAIYDLLCFLFYFSAVLWYATIRTRGLSPSWRESAGICLLAFLAMNSKEMAITLPVMLAVTEVLYGDRRHWRTTGLTGGLAVLAVLRVHFSAVMGVNAAYTTGVSRDAWVEGWRHYSSLLVYRPNDWSQAQALLLIAACILTAVLIGRREARWSCILLLVSPIPVLFIAPRNFYAFYIPYFGFCLLCGSVVGRLATASRKSDRWVAFVTAALLAAWLWPLHRRIIPHANRWYELQEAQLRGPGQALKRDLPALPRGARVLFVDDPFPMPPEDEYTLTFLVRLLAGDDLVVVDRAKVMQQPPAESEWPAYAAVLSLKSERLTVLRPPTSRTSPTTP